MDHAKRAAFNAQHKGSSIRVMVAAAMVDHAADARKALAMVCDWWGGPIPHVAGCGTLERLAVKLAAGRDIEEAAASEWVYRWNLALGSAARMGLADGVRGGWPAPALLGQ